MVLVKQNGDRLPAGAVTGVVLRLKDFATAPLADGSFGFYNLDPGNYTIELDKDRLPSGYEPASPTMANVALTSDAPTRGVERVAWNRGLFVHGGRYNRPQSRTHGCLRARDDELEVLAANAIELRREGDPITRLMVG